MLPFHHSCFTIIPRTSNTLVGTVLLNSIRCTNTRDDSEFLYYAVGVRERAVSAAAKVPCYFELKTHFFFLTFSRTEN